MNNKTTAVVLADLELREKLFLQRNITFKKSSNTFEPDLALPEELLRFLSVNLIGIVLIMMVMTLCYLSHICYNNLWKPTIRFEQTSS
jgi:hypothetical protein